MVIGVVDMRRGRKRATLLDVIKRFCQISLIQEGRALANSALFVPSMVIDLH